MNLAKSVELLNAHYKKINNTHSDFEKLQKDFEMGIDPAKVFEYRIFNNDLRDRLLHEVFDCGNQYTAYLSLSSFQIEKSSDLLLIDMHIKNYAYWHFDYWKNAHNIILDRSFYSHSPKKYFKAIDSLDIEKIYDDPSKKLIAKIIQDKYKALNWRGIVKTYLYHYFAQIAFKLLEYDFAFMFHDLKERQISDLRIKKPSHNKDIISQYIKKQNSENAQSRWKEHNKNRPEKKRQYLQIMRDKGFTTYSDTATYIKQEIETGQTPTYDTVCRWLSQADKGDFT